MRLCLIAPLALALAACAAPEPPAVVASAAPDTSEVHLECHQETSMGSNVIHKVCTRTQSDAERSQQAEALQHQLPNAYLAHPAAGSNLAPVTR